jgi:hypothetical protein
VAQDDFRLLLTPGLRFARHRVLQRAWMTTSRIFDRSGDDAARVRPLIDFHM